MIGLYTHTLSIVLFDTNQLFFLLNPQAKEDAEVLRSLVIPLEEEINALKEKLRANDQQLRKYQAVSQHPFCHLNIF